LIARAVEAWFSRHQRPLPWRLSYDPYLVWVSEVMLQQTRMEVVLGYFERFIARFPAVEVLARATEDDVVAAWSGLGYYRRARMLRDGAIEVMDQHGGRIPGTVEELLTIPGIGRYTAGAIASIAHRQHAPIVDGNVARIASRLFGIDEPVGSPALMRAAWKVAEELVAACQEPRNFNQGLMECGALICTPRKPNCAACPLRRMCLAYAEGRVEELPAKKVKQQTRELVIPLYLVRDDDGRVLMRRESGKLMTAMYHLPHGEATLLTGTPLRVTRKTLLGTFRHTVTTRRIEFRLYAAELTTMIRESAEEYAWVAVGEMERLPCPSYVGKAMRIGLLT
jgi:A/G-specific adenine glycosylase